MFVGVVECSLLHRAHATTHAATHRNTHCNTGVSNESPLGVMEFNHLAQEHNLCRPVSIQNRYHIWYKTGITYGICVSIQNRYHIWYHIWAYNVC